MRWYICRYDAAPGRTADQDPSRFIGTYSSYIWASSWARARDKARRRGIGEVVDGLWGGRQHVGRGGRPLTSAPYLLPSQMLRKRHLTPRQRLDIIHGVTFLAFLLMNCRRSRSMLDHSKSLVGDHGILHEVVHSLTFGRPRRMDIIPALERCERSVPGYVAR